MKKFQHHKSFDNKFQKIEDLIFYPYVGQSYSLENEKRILVIAKERPITEEEYKEKGKEKTSDKFLFANSMNEYSYASKDWTQSFKNFIKAAVGINFNYNSDSDLSTINKIDEFVSQISFTNFIDGFVISESKTNTKPPTVQIESSNRKISEIINILKPTHIICWGDFVFGHIRKLNDYHEIEKQNFSDNFSIIIIENKEGEKINLLRCYHPSYSGFKQLDEYFHKMFRNFFNK